MTQKNLKLATSALRLVVAYDDLMRGYTGPISELTDADNAAIDETYDQMVAAARITLDVTSRAAPPPQDHVTVEEVASAMFKTDWPRDDWSRFGPKDHAAERYRAMARVAFGMLNNPAPQMNLVELVARSQCEFDGRLWLSMPRGERERYRQRAEAAIGAMSGNRAPQEHVGGLILTEWERHRLAQHVAGNALTYIGHHARGGLKPHEIEEMERWKALSEKLKNPPPASREVGK